MENETQKPEQQPEQAQQPDPKGAYVAKRDQIIAAYRENVGLIRQLDDELTQRRALAERQRGSIEAWNEVIGPMEATGA